MSRSVSLLRFFHRQLGSAAIVIAALPLAACATVVSGTSQSVTVMTEPSGARCDLTRDGVTVGIVNPTPGSLTLEKSSHTVLVSCTAASRLPAQVTLVPGFQGMTLGNAIFGGLIGVGIDAASGAMNDYPDSVTVLLPPESFASAGERDLYFEGRAAEIERSHALAMEAADASALCRKDPEGSSCLDMKGRIDSERGLALEQIERQRELAVVDPEAAS